MRKTEKLMLQFRDYSHPRPELEEAGYNGISFFPLPRCVSALVFSIGTRSGLYLM